MNEQGAKNPFLAGLKPSSGVGEIISQVGQAHVGKRKPGRPKKQDSTPIGTDSSTSTNQASTGNVSVQPPVSPIDKELIRKSVESLLRAFDSIIVRRVYQTAMLVSKDDKPFSTQIATNSAITKDELDLIPSLSAEIAAKYQLLGQYAAEILLGICIVGYGTRTVITFNKLHEMAQLRKISDKANKQVNSDDIKPQAN